jgi:hypothetical protein
MSGIRWNDTRLRAFIVRAPRLSWGDDELGDVERDAFREQVALIIASGVRRRVLASVGSPVATEGIAQLACELLEEPWTDQEKRDWLLVTTEPWRYLERWVAEVIIAKHRAAFGRRSKDARVLEGIAAVSTRAELEAPDRD